MKNLIYLSAALVLTSCYGWKRAFTLPKNNTTVTQIESININPSDFFYVRQAEYWDTLKSNYNTSNKSYTTETSARLYKSICVDSTLPSSYIVEENYLYLENYSDTSVNNGRIIHFKTSPFWGDGKNRKRNSKQRSINDKQIHSSELQKYFSNKDTINLSTSVITEFGYWEKDKHGTYHLLLKNAFGSFHIEAIDLTRKELIYKKVTHPNKDNNIRNTSDNNITIEIKDVMNVQQNDGLVYYRNVGNTLKAQRAITTTYSRLNSKTHKKEEVSSSISSIHLGAKNKNGKRKVLINYLKTDDGTILYSRKNHRVHHLDPEEIKTFRNSYRPISKNELKQIKK
ncbi:MAG: hypothetical protein MK066_08965 [Crocinitomicaceae bacterium]|nr:hypothetical protein [Crocinitomicaceae bacterium]